MAENIFRRSQSRKVSERSTPSARIWAGSLIDNGRRSSSELIANEFWNITLNPRKKISLIIKNATGALVASTAVKYGIFEYKDGNPYNFEFMKLTNAGVLMTDANGVLEVLYTGLVDVGGTVYVAVIHPNTSPTESMIWSVTVQ